MTAARESAAGAERQPFADASPAQIRAALTTADAAEFDRQWQTVMGRATRTLDLTEVLDTLEAWRRVAWVTTSTGSERYQAIMAEAERRRRLPGRCRGASSRRSSG